MGHNEHKEAEITINAPGVIVAGMLMLTSFIIIPFLFSTSPSEGFAFQRRGEIFFILSLPPPFSSRNNAKFKVSVDFYKLN